MENPDDTPSNKAPTADKPRSVRLGEDLEKELLEAARAEGLGERGRSKIIKRAVTQYLRAGDLGRVDKLVTAVEALRRTLAPVGSNLNQLALAFNTHGHLDRDELAATHEAARREFRELMQLLRAIADELGRRT